MKYLFLYFHCCWCPMTTVVVQALFSNPIAMFVVWMQLRFHSIVMVDFVDTCILLNFKQSVGVYTNVANANACADIPLWNPQCPMVKRISDAPAYYCRSSPLCRHDMCPLLNFKHVAWRILWMCRTSAESRVRMLLVVLHVKLCFTVEMKVVMQTRGHAAMDPQCSIIKSFLKVPCCTVRTAVLQFYSHDIA